MLLINLANSLSDKNRITQKVTAQTRACDTFFSSHRPSGRDRKVMDPGTDPADTPDSFLLRSLTTARSSDQDFRGTVLSGAVCSLPGSLLDISIFSTRYSCYYYFAKSFAIRAHPRPSRRGHIDMWIRFLERKRERERKRGERYAPQRGRTLNTSGRPAPD